MEQMEMLWAYMQEDIKAEKVAHELRTSPLRQKLEKTRDYILAQQNAYKQIEEHVAISADRKDAVRDALVRCDEQLKSLEKRFVEDPPQDVESAKQMISEVEKCRKTATTYEQEMRRLNKESNEIDNKARSIRQGAAQAKRQPRSPQALGTGMQEGERHLQRRHQGRRRNQPGNRRHLGRYLYPIHYILERVNSTAPIKMTTVDMASLMRPPREAYSPNTNTPHSWFTTRFNCKSG